MGPAGTSPRAVVVETATVAVMRRHAMRKIREVLRLKLEHGCSQREISAATGLSKGAVCAYLRRAREAGVTWDAAQTLDDVQLERQLFTLVGRNLPNPRAPIDMQWVHAELRLPGVTLQQLWNEYCEGARTDLQARRPYQYSQFCDLYRDFRKRVDATMRQVHRAGEKVFVDYSGKKVAYFDHETGERIEVELFVAVLGASNYTFAEASRSQKVADFCASTVRAFEHFGGVPQVVVPDQLRSAVKGPDRLDPEINPTYAELAQHYGTAVIPARPRRPRDKAKVENGVLVVQRWIVACLRHRTFFSLDALNVAIDDLLDRLNERPFKKLDGCRRSAFESIDKPALRPLPPVRFEVTKWKKAKVGIDYHVDFDRRLYSVHHTLIGEHVEVRATVSTIELFFAGRRIASHARSHGPPGSEVTLEAHRPKSHRDYGAWSPERVVSWAATIGPRTAEVAAAIMAARPRPEQGYRSCLALIRTTKRYDAVRIEAACERALLIGSPTRHSVEMILRRNLDQAPLAPVPEPRPPVAHDNVRGGAYYDRKEDA